MSSFAGWIWLGSHADLLKYLYIYIIYLLFIMILFDLIQCKIVNLHGKL